MNRLIKAIAILPLLLLLIKSAIEINYNNGIPFSFWVFGLSVLNLFAMLMSLEKLRDGIKGILYSGLIANFLLVVAVIFGQKASLATVFLFSGYSLGVYTLALLDLLNVKYVDNSKSQAPFHSSGPGYISGHSESSSKRQNKTDSDKHSLGDE